MGCVHHYPGHATPSLTRARINRIIHNSLPTVLILSLPLGLVMPASARHPRASGWVVSIPRAAAALGTRGSCRGCAMALVLIYRRIIEVLFVTGVTESWRACCCRAWSVKARRSRRTRLGQRYAYFLPPPRVDNPPELVKKRVYMSLIQVPRAAWISFRGVHM